MPLESASYIGNLVESNPVGATDQKKFGDDHLRLIKGTVKNTLPNLTSPILIGSITSTDGRAYTMSVPDLLETPPLNTIVIARCLVGNNGSVTLNVESTGANSVLGLDENGALAELEENEWRPGTVVVLYWDLSQWLWGPRTRPQASTDFAGNIMLFYLTAAPTGWAASPDAGLAGGVALRLVTSGAGGVYSGGNNFQTVFNSTFNSNGHTLTESQIPSHVHDAGALVTSSAGSHEHALRYADNTGTLPFGAWSQLLARNHRLDKISTSLGNSLPFMDADGVHTHSVSGNTNNTGGGTSHAHGLSFDLNYANVLVAVKQ